jgi:hypothetical protein
VFVRDAGTFKLSGDARPERVFLFDTSRFITIGGPLNGGTVPLDLVITGSIHEWINGQILRLDSSYSSGNLAALKAYFTLGNAKIEWSDTETPIAGYRIDDGGRFVAQ